jgi:type IV pilus assembly protein PilA
LPLQGSVHPSCADPRRKGVAEVLSSPAGPVSLNRRAFTLIELLVVVVIIGILATISIPKFQTSRGKAYFAGMRSDLHNLTTAEEAFFYDHARYTSAMDSLAFQPSKGDVVTIVESTLNGWSATSSNPESIPHFCAMFLGTAAAVSPATAAGVVACQ